jgi:hypothetical protein
MLPVNQKTIYGLREAVDEPIKTFYSLGIAASKPEKPYMASEM